MCQAKTLVLFIMFSFILKCKSLTEKHKQSAILTDGITEYCDERLKCNEQNHTLCFRNRTGHCDASFGMFNIDESFHEKIMLGHNGIRNRIAERMEVPNMRRLWWDDELEQMARDWMLHCYKYETDPCTLLERLPRYVSPSYRYVNQNRQFFETPYMPPNFIASVIRSWYLEKNDMDRPSQIWDLVKNRTVNRFYVHNNFTQLAHPETQRIGCALARYNSGYMFICNYWPYNENFTFPIGQPTTLCPNMFPLKDLKFENLCTSGENVVTCETIFMVASLVLIILLRSNF